ncbi:MAG: diacylglycerol kinase family protein [Candidatus Parcubacteria bacterium]|nr:diacylglycerol kinase family protein [Candidatus Parcubacteria bacterium]
MNALIIYNPMAGKKRAKDRQIRSICKQLNLDYHWHDLSTGSFIGLNPDSFERIFVAGGDGTIKEVAAWIISAHSQTPIAIIPIGSANILASALGIPFDLGKALKLGLSEKIQKIDAGLINNREYFLIATGCGFDAKVIKNTSRKLKKAWGFLAYIFSLIYSFFNTHANKYFIKIDDESYTVTAQSVFISNFARFFNFNLNPASKINDGYLSLSILKTLNLRDLGIIAFRLIKGYYLKDWRYEFFKAKRIYILPLHKKVPKQIDGDNFELPYLDVRILPQVLNIIANKLP